MSSEPDYVAQNRGTGDTGERQLFTDVDSTLVSMQEFVGRKWHPVIVYHLLDDGPQGFSSLKERIDGISSKMLSESLDALEAAGLVTRTVISDRPVRVEYGLTERGTALEPLLTAMVEWGSQHVARLETGTDGDSHDEHAIGAHAEGA